MALTPAVREAYERSAGAWRTGPERIYDLLAEHVVESCPARLDEGVTLDLGAGSGSVTRAVRRAGGRPVAIDIAPAMLAALRPVPAVAADVLALPIASRSVRAAIAAFCFSHLDGLDAALRDVARVLVSGGVLVASVFGTPTATAFKQPVEDVARAFGYEAPLWYLRLKATEPALADPGAWCAMARRAGFARAAVHVAEVDAGELSTRSIIEWRTGMAHLAPFVAGLGPRRAAFEHDAARAVGAGPHRYRPQVVTLVAHAG